LGCEGLGVDHINLENGLVMASNSKEELVIDEALMILSR
jgi:hypothetical protein